MQERTDRGRDDWADDDAFWTAMAPALSMAGRLALADRDADLILASRTWPGEGAVLDLGCGAGGHAVALAVRGWRVTGVDNSARLLERARAYARSRGADVEWIQSDMRAFTRPRAFDLVCSLYTSFGFFTDDDNRRVLEAALASLRSGGSLLLDVTGRETAAREWRERQWMEIDGTLYLEKRHAGEHWRALLSDWIVVRDGRRQDFHVRQRLYAGDELRDLLSSVGFADVELFGALDLQKPYDETATRLVAVGRAP